MGQYEDEELAGCYYNRFRYYDSESGVYTQKDKIGLNGGMVLYGYVKDTNGWVDVFGLNPDIIGTQASHLSQIIPGLSEAQASSILSSAYNKGAESITFGGSRVRGNYHLGSDLDVGFTGINPNQAGKVIKQNNKIGSDGWLKMEETRIVPGNSTSNISEIKTPEEFFQRSGVRSGGDPKAGEAFGPSGSITAHQDGSITRIDVHGNKTTIKYP